MIILKPINTAQDIKFVQTRVGTPNKAVIVNEITNTSVTIDNIDVTNVSFYQIFTEILDLKEGHFYILSIYEDDTLLHRDKIFCTAQNVDTYSVNNNTYIPANDNIIIYE